ncbi:hypothetical protein, partial [Aeromonas caviae]|uniref:hypothetical protein n=1 Tax=Aeromonas caviae TaxID=648 RepID=UPI002DD63076
MKVATERIFLLLSLLILLISPAHAKNCKKGQPCGNSCISWSKTCRINTYSHQLVAPSTSSTSKVYLITHDPQPASRADMASAG